MCHVKPDGSERTILVVQRKIQRRLDLGDTFGECANAPKVVMCRTKRDGTLRNILVTPRRVQRLLDNGAATLGECLFSTPG
jgi:hypothetical protein